MKRVNEELVSLLTKKCLLFFAFFICLFAADFICYEFCFVFCFHFFTIFVVFCLVLVYLKDIATFAMINCLSKLLKLLIFYFHSLVDIHTYIHAQVYMYVWVYIFRLGGTFLLWLIIRLKKCGNEEAHIFWAACQFFSDFPFFMFKLSV